jgi:spore maturation protein SpmB
MAFDLLALVLCTLFARSGCYELFVDVPRTHIARWYEPWGMPKNAVSIMLAAALVGVGAALIVIVVLRDPGMQRVARLVEVGALVVMTIAWLAWSADFWGSAGRFG